MGTSHGQLSRAGCDANYSPCTCTLFGDRSVQLDCDQVSVQDVQDILNRTTTRDLYRFDWILPRAEVAANLPENFFSDKQSGIIRIACSLYSSTQLSIHPDAFRSSSGYTNQLILSDCDLEPLTFEFLTDFQVLLQLNIYSSRNIQGLQNLPALPHLQEFDVFDCTGFDRFTTFPLNSSPVLETLKLNSNQLDDRVVSLILNAIAGSSSGGTLSYLSVSNNRLTLVPEQLSSLSQLASFYASDNNITFIGKGSLTFTDSVVRSIYLPHNSLAAIESEAFQGMYDNCYRDRLINYRKSFGP